MIQDSTKRTALSKLLASENITVTEGDFPSAWFDTKTRTLGLPNWNVDKDVFDMLIGHEVGHALYTPLEGLESEDVKSLPHSYLNIVEDARIERLIQNRYMGLVSSFRKAYDKLANDDFFGIGNKDVDSLNFADKVNIKAKLGDRIDIEFSDYEQNLFNRIMSSETWEDVIDLTKELVKYTKTQEEQKQESDSDEESESGEGQDSDSGEESESNETETDTQSNSNSSQNVDSDDETGEESDSNEGDSNDSQDGSKETESVQTNAGNEFNDEDLPEIETQNSFDENLQNNVDSDAPLRAMLPPIKEMKKMIHGYKSVASHRRHDRNIDWILRSDEFKTSFNEFMSETKKSVSLLRKEFELKKSSYRYSRSSVSKTGTLNMNKIHSYRYNEDLFLSVRQLADAKNHGLLIFVDFSGSMSQIMTNVIKQMIGLCEFCRLINVPYRIFGFTSSWGGLNDKEKNHLYGEVKLDSTQIFELFSSKMTKAEHKDAIFHSYASISQNYYYAPSSLEQMGGTPLSETILFANVIAKEFKSVNSIQNLTTVFMTDGAGGALSFRDLRGSYSSKIRMNVNGKDVEFSNSSYRDKSLIEHLKKTTGSNTIRIHLMDSHNARRRSGWVTGYGYFEKSTPHFKKNGFDYKDNQDGWDRFFVMNPAVSLKTTVDELEVDENMSRAKIASQFRKFSNSKKTARAFAGTFCEIFS